jgi:hypothetical protein
MGAALHSRFLDMIATLIECCERRSERGPRHPAATAVGVVAPGSLPARGHTVAK